MSEEKVEYLLPERDEKGRLLPGRQSINPNGRPKGATAISKYVRDATRDGQECIDVLIGFMLNPLVQHKDRIQCASLLLDRGFGKPLQQHELLNSEESQNMLNTALLNAYTTEQLRMVVELIQSGQLGRLLELVEKESTIVDAG